MGMVSEHEIQAIKEPPKTSSSGWPRDYEFSCKVCLGLMDRLGESRKAGDRIALKVWTMESNVTVSGSVSNAVVHENLRSAIEEVKDFAPGVMSIDMSSVNVDYGMT